MSFMVFFFMIVGWEWIRSHQGSPGIPYGCKTFPHLQVIYIFLICKCEAETYESSITTFHHHLLRHNHEKIGTGKWPEYKSTVCDPEALDYLAYCSRSLHINTVIHVSFPREHLMRPLSHTATIACLCFMIFLIVMLFLRAMWPFPVPRQFPLLPRSLTPRAFSRCQDWHPGHRGFSLWHCSSGRGTRQASCWPLNSPSRRARSGCIWTTPDFDYRSVKLMGLTWSSVQVRLNNEFFLQNRNMIWLWPKHTC